MVDVPILPELGAAKVGYCWLKCSVEYYDRRRRGATGSPVDERRKFVMCLATCTSPVDLPDRSDDDDDD